MRVGRNGGVVSDIVCMTAGTSLLAVQYLEGVSVTPSSVSKPNTLLIVNGKSSIGVAPVKVGGPAAIQEAAVMMATNRVRG